MSNSKSTKMMHEAVKGYNWELDIESYPEMKNNILAVQLPDVKFGSSTIKSLSFDAWEDINLSVRKMIHDIANKSIKLTLSLFDDDGNLVAIQYFSARRPNYHIPKESLNVMNSGFLKVGVSFEVREIRT